MDPISLVVGAAVSLVVQLVKKATNTTNTYAVLGTVLFLSLVGAGLEVTLQHYGLMSTVLQVLTTAGAFYAFIIRNVSTSTPVTTYNE